MGECVYNEENGIIEEFYEILEIIFSDIDIDEIIGIYNNTKINSDISLTRSLPSKEIFRKFLYNKYRFYSITEIDNIYKCINSYLNSSTKKSIFDLILCLSEHCLCIKNRHPIIKYNKLLKWRMMSLRLDQDIFISMILASSDLKSGYRRTNISWDKGLKTDNPTIHKILDKGLAENHFHLLGSAPHYNISWISLMNDLYNRDNIFDKNISKETLSIDERKYKLGDIVKIAAIIRIYLYNIIVKKEINYNDIFNIDRLVDRLDIENINIILPQIQEKINCLRYDGLKKKDDYFSTSVDKNFYDGERRLLYLCFKEILVNNNEKLESLLYIYILIKSRFRSEIIQVNNVTGFENFQNYQKRKKFFLKTKSQKLMLATESILSSIRNQNVISLEARIVPKFKYNELIKDIKNYDKYIYKAIISEKNMWSNELKIENMPNIVDVDKEFLEKRMYYVFHYPKCGDELIKDDIISQIKPRYYRMRKYLNIQSHNLVKLREQSGYAHRVLGIDGCGNELICRPEAFGQSFRFLKNHYVRNNMKKDIPNLKITYHVGEDFLDIADGLRAVNEAILFLGMSEGDRIGHGIVLGIDIKEWYENKNKRITITKQAFIDNIVWLINIIKKCDVSDKFEIIYYLEKIYNRIFLDIFGEKLKYEKQGSIIDNDIYYLSMLLRGDNPELYINKEYKNYNNLKYWDRCAISSSVSDSIRRDRITSYLYYLYSYDTNIRKRGNELISIDIDRNYIIATQYAQNYMINYVSSKGIYIETNPSSNYMISTFRRYEKHPIIKLYRNNLCNNSNKVNINVSINTDDQGVFDTYLENEYELMALSLEKARDDEDRVLFTKENIYKWIEEVRKMGLTQSFL